MPDIFDGNADNQSNCNNRGPNHGDRQQPNRLNRNRQPATSNLTWFKGKCVKIKNHIYDVSPLPNNYELFLTTTEAIGEFVATEYEYAGKYCQGLPNL